MGNVPGPGGTDFFRANAPANARVGTANAAMGLTVTYTTSGVFTFAQGAEWLEILANVFGKKICLVSGNDASALGAVYLGLKTLGRIGSYTELKPKHAKEIVPDLFIFRKYQKQYKLYQELYKSLASHMETLKQL